MDKADSFAGTNPYHTGKTGQTRLNSGDEMDDYGPRNDHHGQKKGFDLEDLADENMKPYIHKDEVRKHTLKKQLYASDDELPEVTLKPTTISTKELAVNRLAHMRDRSKTIVYKDNVMN